MKHLRRAASITLGLVSFIAVSLAMVVLGACVATVMLTIRAQDAIDP